MISFTRSRQTRRKFLRLSHRYIGVVSAVFLILIAATGTAINHLKDVGMEDSVLTWPPLLRWYGLSNGPQEIVSFNTDSGVLVSWMNSQLFLGKEPLQLEQIVDSPLLGIVEGPGFLAAATSDSITLLTRTGVLIDRLGQENLPGRIRKFGSKAASFFIDTPNGQFRTTSSFLSWTEAPSVNEQVAWSSQRPTPAAVRKQLLDTYQGDGISLQQLLLDLHSGRILGIGPWISDLSALAILLLAISGIINWRRLPR
ncbi:PepSY domain-containing protein [Marinobacter sp.]|uniref:PepSY domain-containing protein n=1 Tax=Marinobacter sp. TaxID=50741 RepID=UPI001B7341CB|nr:PepSY domain-containing protein [Marinobacter sp.]MBQ0832702.1 PepSY domain-containing protein [Marinobacter sp.]